MCLDKEIWKSIKQCIGPWKIPENKAIKIMLSVRFTLESRVGISNLFSSATLTKSTWLWATLLLFYISIRCYRKKISWPLLDWLFSHREFWRALGHLLTPAHSQPALLTKQIGEYCFAKILQCLNLKSIIVYCNNANRCMDISPDPFESYF